LKPRPTVRKTQREGARSSEKTGPIADPVPTSDPTGFGQVAADKTETAIGPDEALRMAIRAALDAGDDARAAALMAILAQKPAPVLALAKGRK
jgi:hypothetical protein